MLVGKTIALANKRAELYAPQAPMEEVMCWTLALLLPCISLRREKGNRFPSKRLPYVCMQSDQLQTTNFDALFETDGLPSGFSG